MCPPERKNGFFLGLDTGTSKTHALVTHSDGKVLGFGEAGCGNYEVVGVEGFKKALLDSSDDAIRMAGISRDEISAMGLGISGFDWPSEAPLMIGVIESLGIPCPYLFTNDVLIGLMAGSSEGWGVAVDAGTGNNVRGKDKQGNTGRITGNSAEFGEIGGGGEMVWLAQIAVTHAWTQRGPKTQLTQVFMDFLEVNTESELIEGMAAGKFHLQPILAQDIFRTAQKGDHVAKDIIDTSAKELALNVNAVIRQLGFQDQSFELVLIGSVFKSGELFLRPFRETVYSFAPAAKLVRLSVHPVAGSILLAAEAIGKNPNTVRKKLFSTIGSFTDR